eukprot:15473329-Alexandrium_andersonii.AAC.1
MGPPRAASPECRPCVANLTRAPPAAGRSSGARRSSRHFLPHWTCASCCSKRPSPRTPPATA